MIKDWPGMLFGAFITTLFGLVVWLIQRTAGRSRNKLEMDILRLDFESKWEEFKREKQAEWEAERDELHEQIRGMTLRYKENIDFYLLQIQENTKKILELTLKIEELETKTNGH